MSLLIRRCVSYKCGINTYVICVHSRTHVYVCVITTYVKVKIALWCVYANTCPQYLELRNLNYTSQVFQHACVS